MNKIILWIASFALSMALGQTAFADTQVEDSGKSCRCYGERFKQMVDSLKLDDTQQAKIKEIKEQTRQNEKADWQQMKTLREQIEQLVQSDDFDQSKLDALINQKKEILGNMMKAKIMAKHQIYSVFNPQQKAQYQQMIKQWEEKHEMSH